MNTTGFFTFTATTSLILQWKASSKPVPELAVHMNHQCMPVVENIAEYIGELPQSNSLLLNTVSTLVECDIDESKNTCRCFETPGFNTSILFEHCNWRASSGCNVLNRQLDLERKCRTRLVDVVTSPFDFCCRLRLFQIFAFCVGVLNFYLFLESVRFQAHGLFPLVQQGSLMITGLRNNRHTGFKSSLENFTWRIDTGCENQPPQSGMIGNGSQLSFVTLYGYSVIFNRTSSCEEESIHLKLEGITNYENATTLIGSSSVRMTALGIRFIDRGLDGCLDEFNFDFRPPWPWQLSDESALHFILLSVIFICSGVLPSFNNARAGKQISVCLFVVLSLAMLVSMCGYLSFQRTREAFYPGILFVGYSCFSLCLAFYEEYLPELFVVFGVYFLVFRLINDCAVIEDCGYARSNPPAPIAAFCGLGLLVLLRRRRFVSSTVKAATPDWLRFEQAWRRLRESASGGCGALEELASAAASVDPSRTSTGFAASDPRQRCRDKRSLAGNNVRLNHPAFQMMGRSFKRAISSAPLSGADFSESAVFEVPATTPGSAGPPVSSLDQLYSQAACLAPVLEAAGREWARRSGGQLDHEPAEGGGGDAVDLALLPEGLRGLVRRRLVKHPRRAVEKAMDCYGGDVSRLLDVCRCRIVFDDIRAAAACLGLIARSVSHAGAVNVVRVRNSLTEAHDAAASGGFRAVVVEACLDTAETRRLGLENHVCEVQLVPREFAAGLRRADLSARANLRALRGRARVRFAAGLSRASVVPAGPFAGQGEDMCCLSHEERGMSMTTVAVVPVGSVSDEDRTARCLSEAGPGPPASEEVFPYSSSSMPVAQDKSAAGASPAELQSGSTGSSTGSIANGFAEGTAAVAAGAAGGGGGRGGRGGSACAPAAEVDPDPVLCAALHSAVQAVCLRFTTGEGGALDRQSSNFAQALNKSNTYSVLFSSRPYEAYIAKPQGKVRAVLLLAFWCFLSISYFRRSSEGGRGLLNHGLVRMKSTVPGRPGGRASANIEEMGLLRGECKASVASAHPGMPMGIVATGGDIVADGYFFSIARNCSADDLSLSWAIEGSDDNGSSWRPVGACSWVTVQVSTNGGRRWRNVGGPSSWLGDCRDGTVSPGSRDGADAGLRCGSELRVSFKQDEMQLWLSIGFLSIPCAWIVALSIALHGRVRLYKRTLEAGVIFLSIWGLCCQAVLWRVGIGVQRAIYLGVFWNTFAGLWTSFGFQFLEAHLVVTFLSIGIFFLLEFGLLCGLVFGPSWAAALVEGDLACVITLAVGCFMLGGSLMFVWFRRRAMRRARRLIVDDKWQYDGIWEKAFSEQAQECYALRVQVRALEDGCVVDPRQTAKSCLLATPSQAGTNRGTILWGMSPQGFGGNNQKDAEEARLECPITSLDQLFVQAFCVHPILISRIKAWARASGGYLCRLQQPNNAFKYVRYQGDEGQDFKWSSLKSVNRAIEKAIRSYGQDVSRLLDVCRQMIAFDGFSDLSACLGLMASDPHVQILRVKNRLDPDYDSSVSGGYRDVNVNLRIRSPAAALVGADSHVCEVQLLLRGMALLKSDEGHRNYVSSRNLRGD